VIGHVVSRRVRADTEACVSGRQPESSRQLILKVFMRNFEVSCQVRVAEHIVTGDQRLRRCSCLTAHIGFQRRIVGHARIDGEVLVEPIRNIGNGNVRPSSRGVMLCAFGDGSVEPRHRTDVKFMRTYGVHCGGRLCRCRRCRRQAGTNQQTDEAEFCCEVIHCSMTCVSGRCRATARRLN
jgi:hypothetical protein